jgi:hypothetical protein
MTKNESDQLAQKLFYIVLIGTIVYSAVVFIFIH